MLLQVKRARLPEVIPILAAAGYDLYSSDPNNLTAQMSPFHSPSLRGSDDGTPLDLSSGAILTRTRSNTGDSLNGRAAMLMSLPPPALPEEEPASNSAPPRPNAFRTKSLSPASSDVQLLPTDLTCVGLADDAADVWALKIVKLVAYPELVVPKTANVESTPLSKPMPPYSGTPQVTPPRTPSPSTSVSSDGEDGYFSASPPNGSSTSLVSSSPSRSAESLPLTSSNPEARKAAARPSHLHRINSSALQPLTAAHVREPHSAVASPLSPGPAPSSRPGRHRSAAASNSATPNYAIPFFSLTRTQEGSSLTAPTTVLTSLFPPSERHMVICSDELDALDSPTRAGAEADANDEMDDEGHEMGDKNGPMRCLQIDLRQFGLGTNLLPLLSSLLSCDVYFCGHDANMSVTFRFRFSLTQTSTAW